MKVRNNLRRIGITGSARAGKTVFLTSLILHLEAHSLAIRKKQNKKGSPYVQTSKFTSVPRRNGAFNIDNIETLWLRPLFEGKHPEFDYQKQANLIRHGIWPEKTVDRSFFRCRFERDDSSISRTEIEFFDFPGERLADVTMVGRDYGQWSKEMLRSIEEDPSKKQHAAAFLNYLKDCEGGDTSETNLLSAFKETLAGMVMDYHCLISPSTFMVDLTGTVAEGKTISEVVSGESCDPIRPRFTGLENGEFVPLPPDARSSMPGIYKKFETHYRRYQREVVEPLAKDLLACHKLIFLMDITDILGSGVQKFNDTSALIKDLLHFLENARGLFKDLVLKTLGPLRSVYGRKRGGPEQIAFVASKADKVLKGDRDKLVPLLSLLVDPIVRNSEFYGRTAYLSCYSVKTSHSLEGKDRILIGKPLWRRSEQGHLELADPNEGESEFEVSKLPNEWPDEWSGSDFEFFEFRPIIPKARTKLPKQEGLERVMEFALDLLPEKEFNYKP